MVVCALRLARSKMHQKRQQLKKSIGWIKYYKESWRIMRVLFLTGTL
jgi:hypothetical protein